jgi:uncharacterized protein (TIGR02246 family)
MTAHLTIGTARVRAPRSRSLRPARRPALAAAALAAALLLGGCDTDTATGTGRPGATALEFVAPTQGDEAGVIAVVAAWDAAWNAGDAAALAATFADDAEFINGRGQLAVGAATVRAQHQVSLAGPFKGSRTTGRVRKITFLSGTTAVVDVDNELTGYAFLPPGTVPTEPGIQRGRHKRVVVKRAGEWQTILMQLTTVAPAQPTP